MYSSIKSLEQSKFVQSEVKRAAENVKSIFMTANIAVIHTDTVFFLFFKLDNT